MGMFIFSLLLLFGGQLANSARTPSSIVTTSYGQVQGVTVQLRDTNTSVSVDVFSGLPYAQPPTGALRLKKPEPPVAWTGVRDASRDRTTCIQTSHKSAESEDCLYLDIVRQHRDNVTSVSLPVMVYIHGGGWRGGSKNTNGQYLATKGVIDVFINYRLGPLGFLSTEDDSMPGNYGVMDQIAALKWVQANIGAFGGDPTSVTIFGESAGSSSVSQLIFSPLAKGLFVRAIMMSGVATAMREVTPPSVAVGLKDVTLAAGKQLGCTQNPGPDFLACMQKVDVLALYNASVTAGGQDHTSGPFRPRVETTFGFMPDYPYRLLARGEYNHISTIRGFNSQEQAGEISDKANDGLTRQEFLDEARHKLRDYPYVDTDVYVKLMEDVYLENITDPLEIRTQAVDMVSDFTFILPTIRETQLFSTQRKSGGKQFLYKFNHLSSRSSHPDWMGVTHGMNKAFVFGLHPASQYTAADLAVSDMMMTMWTNFAKFGDPTPRGQISQPLISWHQFTSSNPTYLNIEEHLQMKTFDSVKEKKRLDLYEKTVQDYIQAAGNTNIVG